MIASSVFQRNKVARNINLRGSEYTFKRYGINKFKEKSELIKTISIKGLFHNTVSYVSIIQGEATRKQKKFTPTILMLYDDFEMDPLNIDDEVEFMGQKYKVTGWVNIEEGNYAIDISLEVIAIV